MWVKICGTTTHHDAMLAVAAGADAVGFVFAPSKRRVDAEQTATITAALPETVEKVGVFQQTEVAEIARIAHACRLTAVQLHFPYDRAVTDELSSALGPDIKLLQVISCSSDSLDEAALRHQLRATVDDPNLWGILMDASTRNVSGGTGTHFDWQCASRVLESVWPQRTSGQGPKLILAGGLRQENVAEAVATLKPFGVDVVSGVEAAPGVKLPERVSAFVHTARSS